jgi:hypothetical protein
MCCLPFLDALMLNRIATLQSGEPTLDITTPHGEAINHMLRLTKLRPGELAAAIGISPTRISLLSNDAPGSAKSLSFTPLKALEGLCTERGYPKLAEYWRRQAVAALDRVARQGGRR